MFANATATITSNLYVPPRVVVIVNRTYGRADNDGWWRESLRKLEEARNRVRAKAVPRGRFIVPLVMRASELEDTQQRLALPPQLAGCTERALRTERGKPSRKRRKPFAER